MPSSDIAKRKLTHSTSLPYFEHQIHPHLFIFNLERGQAGLQLVVAHQELCLDRLLRTHLTHLGLKGRNRPSADGIGSRDEVHFSAA